MARITALSALLDPSGSMLLAERYEYVVENVQKRTLANLLKNVDLSGDPESGTVEAKRFVNAKSQLYGTARAAHKGDAIKGKPVTIPIDTDREFVEELEQKDVSLLGVEGLINRRTSNHAMRMAAELDEAFFDEAKTSGSQFLPKQSLTDTADIVEAAIVAMQNIKNDYIDGLDREMLSVIMDAETYSEMRKSLDKSPNSNIDTAANEFYNYHGVKAYQSNRLPTGVKFIVMLDGSIAQPVMSNQYAAEKIGLSEAYAVSLFFHYGTKAVTPETIMWYDGTSATS